MTMILIHTKSGAPAHVGDKVWDHNGAAYRLRSWAPPRHAASTGRVYVTPMYEGYDREFFPGVVDCRFIEEALMAYAS